MGLNLLSALYSSCNLRFDSFFEKEKAASREGFAGRFVQLPSHFVIVGFDDICVIFSNNDDFFIVGSVHQI